ncbi:hypothetical protein E2F46_17215 [Luteimonas aestuarii]|uniref:Transcription factor zinc-finger domain-containing protein n=2 Tax=Luteimonas aestuarii TaxID=453837 RepID=A0A4V3AL81_9GAMM|nr:hypothetical protein E2F46_17215 [Luteimonas aestuarii]
MGSLHEWHCTRCDGLWLPGRVVRDAIGTAAIDHLPTHAVARRLRCPDDGSTLVPVMHHGVEVDVCPQCTGAWLDAGERDKILRAKPSTGQHIVREASSDPESSFNVLDATGDAIGTLLEFIGDALSGL